MQSTERVSALGELTAADSQRILACCNACIRIPTPLLTAGIVEDYIVAVAEATAYVKTLTTPCEHVAHLVSILLAIRSKIETLTQGAQQ